MSSEPPAIFLIRHGEKPPDAPPPHGVDEHGDHDKHSLITRGWQRAGALVTLFSAPYGRLPVPTRLIAPAYDSAPKNERTHQTLQPLEEMLGLTLETPYAEGHEVDLGRSLAAARSGVTLVCWEHKAIPVIAGAIAPGAAIPGTWPGDRFDVVWSFTLDAGGTGYAFTQIPQLLLAGDSPDPIPVRASGVVDAGDHQG